MSKKANKIRDLIDKSGKTTKEISESLDITYSTLANYYQGKRSPRSVEVWKKLADYFNVSTPYLMGLVDEGEEIRQKKVQEELIDSLGNVVDFSRDIAFKRDWFGDMKLTNDPIEIMKANLENTSAFMLREHPHNFENYFDLIMIVVNMGLTMDKYKIPSEEDLLGTPELEEARKDPFYKIPKSVQEQQNELHELLGEFVKKTLEISSSLTSDQNNK